MRGDVTGGSFPLAGDLTLTRMGFGAMQLAGPGVWGPPRDRGAAIRVLRTVVELGLTHIDTAGFYGPDTVNDLIREALHPYPDDLHIVTKVGYRRARDRSWHPAFSREDLIASVHGNLRHLGLEALDVVNFRAGAPGGTSRSRAGRRAVRRPRRAAEPGPDQVPGPQQRHRRPAGRGAARGTGRVRAEPVQPGPPRGRPAARPVRGRGHRVRAVLPAGRVLRAAGRALDDVAARLGLYAAAGRSRLAAAPIPEHPADPGHVLVRAPAGQRQRRHLGLPPDALAALNAIAGRAVRG